jgi:hypothetical protein
MSGLFPKKLGRKSDGGAQVGAQEHPALIIGVEESGAGAQFPERPARV